MAVSKDVERMLGDPKAAIRSMFVPFFIAFAVVELNQFVDTYWVSGLGAKSAEAVATIVPIYGLMMCAGLGVSVGSTTSIAYKLGNGDTEGANRLGANSLILGLILGIVVSIIVALLLDPAIDLIGAGDVREESTEYMMPFILLSPILLTNSIMGGMLRGEGAARKSTILQMSAAILNMVIDPILIYGLGMGVMGAGLATVLSAGIATVLGFYWYFAGKTQIRLDRTSFRFDRDAMRDVLSVGGPTTLRDAISNITDLIQRVFIIIAGGTTAVMLYNFSWRYIGMVSLPSRAVETGTIPVCSAAYGQSDLRKMKEGYIYAMKLSIALSLVFTAILIIFAEPLMSILTYEESMHELLPEFVWTLQVSAILIPFNAMKGASSALLQAMKRAKIPMYFMLIWGFVKLVLYAIAAEGWMGVDPFEGIIYSMVALHIFGGLFMMWIADREYEKLLSVSNTASE